MFTVFIIMFVIRVSLFLNEIIKCDLRCFYFILFLYTAYFNHAANLLKYFDKLLKKIKYVTLNRLTDLY